VIPRQLWQRDLRVWPDTAGGTVLAIDFHNVLQIRKGRDHWVVPIAHIELLHALKQRGWIPVVISYVGSDWRYRETQKDIHESGIAREVGQEGSGFIITRDKCGKFGKSGICKSIGAVAIVDDSAEILEDCRRAGIYTIPINTYHVQHPEGYSNLTQALAVERILYKRALQDR
jgi:hypothetical protein